MPLPGDLSLCGGPVRTEVANAFMGAPSPRTTKKSGSKLGRMATLRGISANSCVRSGAQPAPSLVLAAQRRGPRPRPPGCTPVLLQ